MKRGKKYVEAAKAVDRATLYDAPEAISLVKKAAVAKFTSVQAAMDVTQISRFVEQLFCHTEQVKKFVYLYLPKMLRQKRQRQQEQTS